jgi:hypothetical protein
MGLRSEDIEADRKRLELLACLGKWKKMRLALYGAEVSESS